MPVDGERQRQLLELLERHGGILHRIERLYAADADDGKDLLQEIVMQLWRSLPGFRGDSQASTWLYRVALNTALLHSRRRANRTRHLATDEAALERASSPPAEPEGDVQALYRCIRRLPELDRMIVMLHLEGATYEEIASTTGLSRSNVSVRLVRIRKRLRAGLVAEGVAREEGTSHG